MICGYCIPSNINGNTDKVKTVCDHSLRWFMCKQYQQHVIFIMHFCWWHIRWNRVSFLCRVIQLQRAFEYDIAIVKYKYLIHLPAYKYSVHTPGLEKVDAHHNCEADSNAKQSSLKWDCFGKISDFHLVQKFMGMGLTIKCHTLQVDIAWSVWRNAGKINMKSSVKATCQIQSSQRSILFTLYLTLCHQLSRRGTRFLSFLDHILPPREEAF